MRRAQSAARRVLRRRRRFAQDRRVVGGLAMRDFETLPLPDEPSVVAPDGTLARVLLRLAGGSLAHFTLPAGATSHAVKHRTVEEIWYFLSGRGEIWRASDAGEDIVAVGPGMSLTI